MIKSIFWKIKYYKLTPVKFEIWQFTDSYFDVSTNTSQVRHSKREKSRIILIKSALNTKSALKVKKVTQDQ